MRARLWLTVVGIVFTGMGFAGVAYAANEPAVEYTADAYLETAYGVQQGPIYVAPGLERREFNMDGAKMISINRRNDHVIWSLMPEEKMYMEMKPSAETSAGDLSAYKFEMTRVGTETVNGVQTTKNKLIMTGPNGEKMGGFSWITDNGIVVKMDAIAADKNSKERLKIELKNLKVGHVDRAMFEIPSDYTKMDLMGGLGKAMFGGDDDTNDTNDNGDSNDNGDGNHDQAQPKEKKKGFGWRDAIDLFKP